MPSAATAAAAGSQSWSAQIWLLGEHLRLLSVYLLCVHGMETICGAVIEPDIISKHALSTCACQPCPGPVKRRHFALVAMHAVLECYTGMHIGCEHGRGDPALQQLMS